MLEIKSIATEMKNAFEEFITSRTQLRKECLNLSICHYKPPKLKSKENKGGEKIQNTQRLWDSYKNYKVHLMVIPK